MKKENINGKYKKEYGKSKEDILFIICVVLIILFSLFIIVYPTPFYQKLNKTMHNNVNLNIQINRDEKLKQILEEAINGL